MTLKNTHSAVAVGSMPWLDSECITAAASSGHVASQRNGGCDDSSRALYKTIVADPPWAQKLTGKWKLRPNRAESLPYPTMSVDEICAMRVADFAAPGAHLWLWTTNEFLEAGFSVMRAWGFRYLAPVTWVKPCGVGAWFVHRTQTILFGYRAPLRMRERYKPTVIEANPGAHSAKPEEAYRYIEGVSEGPRLEIFARPWTPMFERRDGWDVWGNEVTPTAAGSLTI